MAVTGVIVLAKSIRITKFQAASEIPSRFIERNVSLRGKVHSVTERGIEVEHIPIYLPVISPLLSKQQDVSTSRLWVHLAGVELTPEGKIWLQKNLVPPQTVWLKLISRQDSTLHCLYYLILKCGTYFSISSCYCMNEELLRLGLARRTTITGVPLGSPLYWRLHKRLHRAEVKAEKKGLGLWKKESLWERASIALKGNPLLRLMRRIFRRTRTE
uniref:TNase-like domain-containing protein n=1 Tax=Cyprinodon variegatus TaxID=28743 RepID=A0A3Q2FLH3_CYPVA